MGRLRAGCLSADRPRCGLSVGLCRPEEEEIGPRWVHECLRFPGANCSPTCESVAVAWQRSRHYAPRGRRRPKCADVFEGARARHRLTVGRRRAEVRFCFVARPVRLDLFSS